MLQAGQQAPSFEWRPIFGKDLKVPRTETERPLLLCFFQHSNSPICRQGMANIQDRLEEFDLGDIDIAAVIPSSLLVARDFVPRFHILFPVIADSDHELYQLYQIPRVSRLDAIKEVRPWMLKETARHLQQGFGPNPLSLEGSETQLPAYFVIHKGTIVYASYGQSIRDLPDVDALLEAGLGCYS